MGELGDYWREHREYKKGVKARRRENMPNMVERIRNSGYELTEHNQGEHVRITTKVGIVDYWPSTGRWTHGKKTAFGIKKLLNYLRQVDPVDLDIPY